MLLFGTVVHRLNIVLRRRRIYMAMCVMFTAPSVYKNTRTHTHMIMRDVFTYILQGCFTCNGVGGAPMSGNER